VQRPGAKGICPHIRKNDIVFAVGPAGTGKTYLAVAFAVAALKNNEIRRLSLHAPLLKRGRVSGFLPGDLKEKIDPYLRPLYDGPGRYDSAEKLRTYLERRVIEIAPLAYMRGRTINNAYVILDEGAKRIGNADEDVPHSPRSEFPRDRHR